MVRTRCVALLVLWSAGGVCAHGQQNPGLAVEPSGRSLAEPDATPVEKPVDLRRPQLQTSVWTEVVETDALREAAENGQGWAQTQMARMYLEPPETPERVKTAVMLLQKAAEQGDADALFQLGALYMAGYGVERSTELAFDYCKRAAELGHANAQYELAAMYALGRGTPVDPSLALQWGRKAVAQNHTKAKYSIGRMLLIGEDRARQAEAVRLLEQAANENINEAALLLAEAYADGLHGLPANRARAIKLLQPVAQRGHPEAVQLMERLDSSAD